MKSPARPLLAVCLLVMPTVAAAGQTRVTATAHMQPEASGGSARERADRIVQETRFLRTLNQARLTSSSQQTLLALLQAAETQLREHERAATSRLEEAEKRLQKAKAAVIAGAPGPAPDETAAATTLRQVESERQGITTRLREHVRQFLQTSLSPAEHETALLAGQALVRHEREAVIARRYFGGAQGNTLTTAARELDRVRSDRNYPSRRMIFALHAANVPNWWVTPGLYGPGNDAGNPEGLPPPNLNDPALQQRLQPLLSAADQIRSLPPGEYQRQREQLARQLDAARRHAFINAPVSDQEALDALAQALAQPQMADVLRTKLKHAPAPVRTM